MYKSNIYDTLNSEKKMLAQKQWLKPAACLHFLLTYLSHILG